MTLPLVVAILGGVSFPIGKRDSWLRLSIVVGAIGVIACLYLGSRAWFIPDAPQPQVTAVGFENVLTAIGSALRPGGSEVSSRLERAAGISWNAFVAVLALVVVSVGRARVLRQCVVACVLGGVLSLPALGVLRPFGVALPTFAFMSAIAIAIMEIFTRLTQGSFWLPAA